MVLDDLEQFVAAVEQQKAYQRSPVARWFAEHPDVAAAVITGHYEREYSVATLYSYVIEKHGFTSKRCAFDAWLKARRPA